MSKTTGGKAVQRQLRSVPEAAKALNVSVYALRRWIRLRRLPHHRIGRRVMLAEGDLERFVEAGRVEAREEAGR